MRKFIILGAGTRGKKVLEKYGMDYVVFFADNSPSKWGTTIKGIPVISFDEMVSIYDSDQHIIIVSPEEYIFLTGQLELAGIDEYVLFKAEQNHNHLKALNKIEADNSTHNEILNEYVERSHEYDLLDDISAFSNIVSEVLEENKKGLELIHFGIGEEGNFYGNLNTLLKYAGHESYNKIYAPNISHNALAPLRSTETMYKSAVVFSGKYYKEKIHRWRPYVPVFSIGPYIQYAKGIYSEDIINEKKKNNGKTLTVFLPHSIEKINRNYRKEDFIDSVINKYGDFYDTILLSIYWADILDPVCTYAEKKGMKLVTSGFRFDEMFNERLKSIFELTDAIVGGDYGTHYNYAYYLGLKASRIEITDNKTIGDCEVNGDIERQVQFDEFHQKYRKEFYCCYDETFRHDKAQEKWLKPYAGYGITRSPEYIRNIFDISKDILIECNGELNDYPNAVRRTYFNYEKNGDVDKQAILLDATGSYLYY